MHRIIGIAPGPTQPVSISPGGKVQVSVTLQNTGAKGEVWIGGIVSSGESPYTWGGRVALRPQSGAAKVSGINAALLLDTNQSGTITFVSDPIQPFENVFSLDVYLYCGMFDVSKGEWTRYDDQGVHRGVILVGLPKASITQVSYVKV